jgi:hypothetical protein
MTNLLCACNQRVLFGSVWLLPQVAANHRTRDLARCILVWLSACHHTLLKKITKKKKLSAALLARKKKP